MSLLTFVALAFTLTQQSAVPEQASVSGTVLEAGRNTPVAGAQVTLISFAYRPQLGAEKSGKRHIGCDRKRVPARAIEARHRHAHDPLDADQREAAR